MANRFKIFRRKLKSTGSRVALSFKRDGTNKKLRRRKFRVVLKVLSGELFKNKFFRVSIIVVISCLLIILGRFFLFGPEFEINEIQIHGCNSLDAYSIEEKLSYLKGKNIFFVRASRVGDEVLNISPYIMTAKAEKHLPGTIIVNIEERRPSFLWINLNGAYLVDNEGFILEVIVNYNNFEISEEDLDLLRGYGNLKEIEESRVKEENSAVEDTDAQVEESADEIAEELTLEEKYVIIEGNRQEVISRVDSFWEEKIVGIPEVYMKYPFVFSYEQREISIREEISEEIVSSTKVGIGIDSLGEDVVRYIWESNYRFVIYLARRRKIVFTTRRNFDEQVNDLDVLLDKFKKENLEFVYIDLSGDIIVYELEE
ncbi:FtsQ-type POTRA domain-containing protein [Candidatus Dojkabacteria bacterium]|nr:FtsQ-type POTRA domain-containing protein [Candidatus Dojkabacteria bacterium]